MRKNENAFCKKKKMVAQNPKVKEYTCESWREKFLAFVLFFDIFVWLEQCLYRYAQVFRFLQPEKNCCRSWRVYFTIEFVVCSQNQGANFGSRSFGGCRD